MKYRVPNHIHHRAVQDEVVILDSRTDAYLGLNGTAAVVWNALARDGSVELALQALTDRYDVNPEDAQRDVRDLLVQLESRALIERIG